MRSKKAQIAIFLVVGVLLLLVFAVSNLIEEQDVPDVQITSSPTQELKTFVEACLHQAAKGAIYTVTRQGGYYYAPINSVFFEGRYVTTYWEEEADSLPILSDIEQHISIASEVTVGECLDEFSFFLDQGYSIDAEPLWDTDTPIDFEDIDEEEITADSDYFLEAEEALEEAFANEEITGDEDFPYDEALLFSTTINHNDVFVQLRYPITLIKGSEEFSISEFSTRIPIDVLTPYNHADSFLQRQAQSPNALPLGFLGNLADENDITFEVAEVDDNSTVISFFYPIENSDDLVYSFGVIYDWGTLDFEDDFDQSILDAFMDSSENFTVESVMEENGI